MPICQKCSEKLGRYAALCHVCGTPVAEAEPAPTVVVTAPTALLCYRPSCGKTYAADFADTFCECGIELQIASPPSAGLADDDVVAIWPPPRTPSLILLGEDKEPLAYFPLTKDATLLGRLDPMAGVYPDVDVAEFLDQIVARKVSRQHALILRAG